MSSAERWCHEHGLTSAERDVLFLAATDMPREEIAARRNVLPSTIKGQVKGILAKTGCRSLDHAALRLVLEELRAVHEGSDAGPFVCPGCHAVGAERCAADCIDAEVARGEDEDDDRDDEVPPPGMRFFDDEDDERMDDE